MLQFLLSSLSCQIRRKKHRLCNPRAARHSFSINNYPPAKPGGLHRRAKPWNTSARVTSRWYGLPAARVCYLPPVNGLIRSFPSSVVPLPGPLRAGVGCILRFSLHFCPLYLHNNHHADRFALGTNRDEREQTNGRLSCKIRFEEEVYYNAR